MENAHKTILEGLLAAMRAEHEGFHFYSMAAKNTEDEKGRAVFIQLADDEREHLSFLKGQYVAMRDNGAPDQSLSLKDTPVLRGSSPIFSDSLKTRVKDAHFEMTALSIGVQMELDAVKHYRKLSDDADDPYIKQFFEQLSEWESSHYHALLAQQESLQADYWSQNGFSPM